MLLFLDTETTGKWNFHHAWDWPGQPHLVQLAAQLCQPSGEVQRTLNLMIQPVGWTIPAKATAIHHITTEWALAHGVPLDHAAAKLQALIVDADEDQGKGRLVAHNINFDLHVAMAALQWCDTPLAPLALLRPFCTMRALTTRMALPGKFGKPKWPTLDEAHRFMFPDAGGIAEVHRHSAMGDLLACRDIFWEGQRREWWV